MQFWKRKHKDKIDSDVSIAVDILLKKLEALDESQERIENKLDMLLMDATEGVKVARGRIIEIRR